MLCKIFIVQIQPRKYVLDPAGFTGPALDMSNRSCQAGNRSALQGLPVDL